MDLIDYDPTLNILPFDGEAHYFGRVLTYDLADEYFKCLLNTIQWNNDQLIIHGKAITTRRKVAWYGDHHYAYRYSNTTKHAIDWSEELLTLKTTVETLTQTKFNSCLLNLYHDGEDSMSWHSDDETALGHNTSIASLSFGADRKFMLKHKQNKKTISLTLENGSLLLMKGQTQTNWLHCLPKMKNSKQARVNLTFRTFRG